MKLKKHPEVPQGYTRAQASEYSRIRLQVLISVFLCYSAYYLVRKDFVLVVPDLAAQGWSKQNLGLVMAVMTVSYGLSNMFMGFIADKVSVRQLMPFCLLVSVFVSLGLIWVTATSCSLWLIVLLMMINGWMQGVGWPSSAKVIAHWFPKEERGRATSFWNLSNNLGAGLLGPLAILGLAICSWWQIKLLLPALLALSFALVCWRWIRDRPECCGLPPLQNHDAGKDLPLEEADKAESGFRGFASSCLKMPQLWLLATLNVCVYFIRFGVIDWVPLYMIERCGVSFEIASWAFTTFEFAAIPGTLLCGYVSDKLFKGRRVPVNLLNISLVLLALLGYWHCSGEHWLVPVSMLGIIGFLIYGSVVLLHVHIIDIAPRRYVAACVGFCGLFGYLLGASGANLVLGGVIDNWGWDGGFQLITSIGIVAVLILLLLWQIDNNRIRPDDESVDKGKTEPSLGSDPVAERITQL